MATPDVSVIIPSPTTPAALRASVASALAARASVEVLLVIDDACAESAAQARELCADPRVLLLTSDLPLDRLEARRLGLEAASGAWVTFLDPGRELTASGLNAALGAAEAGAVSLVMTGRDGRETLVPDGSVVHAVFSENRADLSLTGVVAERSLATAAFRSLPHAAIPTESGIVALFALCYEAPGLALIAEPVAEPVVAPAPDTYPLDQFEEGCLASKAAGAVGRVISRKDDWECHRHDYEALTLRLLEPLVAPFPGNVPHEDRGEAFQSLAEAWPAPELAAAIAHWKAQGPDALTPLLEAASLAELTSRPASGRVSAISLLCPPGCDPLALELDRQAASCAVLGVEASALADAGALVPDVPTAVLPAWTPGESYLPRARALVRAVREHGADALAAPLVPSPSLALDLLCARLAGVPTVLLAPQGAQSLLGAPASPDGLSAPQLLRVAQAAEVIGCPTPRNARFWSYAAPQATVVPVGDNEGADQYWSRLFDALEEEPDTEFLPPRPSVFSTEAASIARSLHTAPEPVSPAAAARRIRELEEQTALLEARLAAAHDEARTLRRQLVDAGVLPAGAPARADRPSQDWD